MATTISIKDVNGVIQSTKNDTEEANINKLYCINITTHALPVIV